MHTVVDVDSGLKKLEGIVQNNNRCVRRLISLVEFDAFDILPSVRSDVCHYFESAMSYDGRSVFERVPVIGGVYDFLCGLFVSGVERHRGNRVAVSNRAVDVLSVRKENVRKFVSIVDELYGDLTSYEVSFESSCSEIDMMLGDVSPVDFSAASDYGRKLFGWMFYFDDKRQVVPVRRNFNAIIDDAFEWYDFCIDELKKRIDSEQRLYNSVPSHIV